MPLSWTLTGGNRQVVSQLAELIAGIPAVRGQPGRATATTVRLYADRGYDHDKYRRLVRSYGITPVIARRLTAHGSGLGQHRWVGERTFAWLHNRRRLLLHTDRSDLIQEGFLAIACCLICWRRLEGSFG